MRTDAAKGGETHVITDPRRVPDDTGGVAYSPDEDPADVLERIDAAIRRAGDPWSAFEESLRQIESDAENLAEDVRAGKADAGFAVNTIRGWIAHYRGVFRVRQARVHQLWNQRMAIAAEIATRARESARRERHERTPGPLADLAVPKDAGSYIVTPFEPDPTPNDLKTIPFRPVAPGTVVMAGDAVVRMNQYGAEIRGVVMPATINSGGSVNVSLVR